LHNLSHKAKENLNPALAVVGQSECLAFWCWPVLNVA